MTASTPGPPAGEADRVRRHSTQSETRRRTIEYLRQYAVLILLVVLFVVLSVSSSAFFTVDNLLNIVNQNVPLAIVAMAGTFVIISGGFDLSTGAMFAVVNVFAAGVAVHINVWLGLGLSPFVGLLLGALNGVLITQLRIHSFLATLATSLAYRAVAVLITGGTLISVLDPNFAILGGGRVLGLYWAVVVLIVFAVFAGFLLNMTSFGRYVFAVGGNQEAAELSGVAVNKVRVAVFAFSGMAAGAAAAIGVSRISSGEPLAGTGLELQAIAAVILGGTSIYGGVGAVWRSLCGVYLIALIGNGFNILNVNPLYKDLVTGVIILAAVALSAGDRRRR